MTEVWRLVKGWWGAMRLMGRRNQVSYSPIYLLFWARCWTYRNVFLL